MNFKLPTLAIRRFVVVSYRTDNTIAERMGKDVDADEANEECRQATSLFHRVNHSYWLAVEAAHTNHTHTHRWGEP